MALLKFDYRDTIFSDQGCSEARLYAFGFLIFVALYLNSVRYWDFWFAVGMAAVILFPFGIGMVRPITWCLIGRNEHIEIENDTLRFYDALQKLRAEGPVDSISYLGRELPGWPGIPTKHRLRLDGIEFRVFENISDFSELCGLLGLSITAHR